MRSIILPLTLSLTLGLAACQAAPLPQAIQQQSQVSAIRGQVHWPARPGLQVQATLEDIQAQATVSLSYPNDHPTQPNRTIATGLTNANGQFILNPDSNFAPAPGTILVLEASKRVQGPGADLLTLRTFLRWEGSNGWNSITGSSVSLNALTTAIAMMAAIENSFSAADTIGSVSQGILNTALGSVSSETVGAVQNLVEQSLWENQDPGHFIYWNGNAYARLSAPLPSFSEDPSPSAEPTEEPSTEPTYTPTPTPLPNSDLLVNTYTAMNQELAADDYYRQSQSNTVSQDAVGNFVVAWTSDFQDEDEGGIYAQRYNADGQKIGAEFRVNQTTLGNQRLKRVVMALDGQFCVLWTGPGAQGQGNYLQHYAADGTPLSDEIKSDPYNQPWAVWGSTYASLTTYNQHLIYTESSRYLSSPTPLHLFNAESNPQWRTVEINTYNLGESRYYTNTVNSQGLILAAWEQTARDGSGAGIFGQLVTIDGGKTGGDFQINTTVQYHQTHPQIMSLSNDHFVVIWDSQQADNSQKLMGQVIDTQGQKVGAEFEVPTAAYTNNARRYLVRRPEGGFQVAVLQESESYDYMTYYRLLTLSGANYTANGQQLTTFNNSANLPSFFTPVDRWHDLGVVIVNKPYTLQNLSNFDTPVDGQNIYLRTGTFGD